jgi:hypothetical protein
MALGIAKYAPNWCECEIIMPGDVGALAAERFDAFLQFSWYESQTWIKKRIVSLVASHAIEHDPWRSTLAKTLADPSGEDWRASVASRLSNRSAAAERFGRLSGIIAVTDRLQRAASSIPWAPKVVHIPAGVDTPIWPRTQMHDGGEKLRVGWCGQYHPGRPDVKGRRWILEPLMRRMTDEIEWVVNDRTPSHALSQREMVEWYSGIDVLLITSVNEGTPLTALEAMSCGRPVVATSVGDMPALLSDGMAGALIGEYFDADTARQVIAKAEMTLRELTWDRETLQRLGWAAGTIVRTRRNWKTLASRWLSFVAGRDEHVGVHD